MKEGLSEEISIKIAHNERGSVLVNKLNTIINGAKKFYE